MDRSTSDRRRGAGRAPRRGRGGVTLMELVVAMAISAALVTMTMQSLTMMSEGLTRVQMESTANDEAKLLNDYLSTQLVAVGGGSVRPWMTLWMEDAPETTGSDALTWATLADTRLQCSVEEISGDTLTVAVEDLTCCLSEDFLHRQVMIVAPESEGAWINRGVAAVDVGDCTLTLTAGHAPLLDVAADDESAYSEGVVVAINTFSIWVDHDAHLLKMGQDYDLDGEPDTRILADRVYDLQVALGYDVDPWDWKVTDTQDNADEWLYNAAGDTFSAGDSQGLAYAGIAELRMIAVGVVVGAPVTDRLATAPLTLLNGPTRHEPGVLLRGFVSVVGLRNYDIMR